MWGRPAHSEFLLAQHLASPFLSVNITVLMSLSVSVEPAGQVLLAQGDHSQFLRPALRCVHLLDACGVPPTLAQGVEPPTGRWDPASVGLGAQVPHAPHLFHVHLCRVSGACLPLVGGLALVGA